MAAKTHPVCINTFADLLEHGYRLSGSCRGCGVNRDVDLARCPSDQPYVGRRFKCRDCGSNVMITVSKIVTGGEHLPALEVWRKR